MSVTIAWDWNKGMDERWLVPSQESAWLAERWAGRGWKRVLDLGAGLGRHAVYLAKRGFQVTACDLAPEGLDYAAAWARREGVGLETVQADMLSLPFPDGGFDCVLAYNAIYHTDTGGLRQSVAEIRRVLKPGGELFVNLVSKNSPAFLEPGDLPFLDESTILRRESWCDGVPHHYVSYDDLTALFDGWRVEQPVREYGEYKPERRGFVNKHWAVLAEKPDA